MDDYDHPTVKRLRRKALAKITIGADHDAAPDGVTDDFVEAWLAEPDPAKREQLKRAYFARKKGTHD